VTLSKAKELVDSRKPAAKGEAARSDGYLVLTNRRMIFAAKATSPSDGQTVTYSVKLEDIASVSHARIGFNDRLEIVEKSKVEKNFVEPDIQSMIEPIRAALARRKLEMDEQGENTA
jgi:hypothetical protein